MVNRIAKLTEYYGFRPLYAGIDVGTSKVGLSIVGASGRLVWSATTELPPSRRSPRTGLSVQSPNAWMKSCKELFDAARASLDTSRIQSVGVTATTPTFLFLRADGSLLVDEAVMWSDPNRDGPSDPSGRNAGLRKLSAINRIAPTLIRHSTFIVDSSNYIAYRLTGALTTGAAFLSQKMMWSPSSKSYTRYFRPDNAAVGTSRFPHRVVATGDVIGHTISQAAQALHIRMGIPVIHAGFDSVAAMIGAGVYRPSDMLLVSTGTSVVFYMVPSGTSVDLGPWVPREFLLPGQHYVITGGFEAGLQSIRLLHKRLLLTCNGQSMNRRLERLAAEGERKETAGTFALPFGGVPLRAPLPEVVLPTAIFSNSHLPSDQTMLVAMRRGVAYYLRYALDDLRRRGVEVSELRLVGGGTNSKSFCQLLADVCELPVSRLSGNAAAAGAALLAITTGMNASERTKLIDGCVRGKTLAPIVCRRTLYDEGYARFVASLEAALRNTHQSPKMQPEYVI
jgi:xylulokinase